MVFKKLLGALGVGGPSVDTVLEPGPALPGGLVTGEVRLRGGGSDVTVDRISLLLVARVEMEGQDEEHEGTVVLERFTVGGGFRLAEEAEHTVPFTVTLPWETPITELHGQHLGPVLGIRTELEVAGARDKGDLDALAVGPLPAQEAILEAFGQLGYAFRSADLELGHIRGTGQQLPCYQEIEILPPAGHAHAVNEIEVTFIATPGGLEIVIEADKRAGLFSDGHDTVHRFTASHHAVPHTDWNAQVDAWLKEVLAGHEARATSPSDVGHHGDQHRSGPGTGAVVAGVAAGVAVGVVGGMVAAEVVDEIGDAFEDDEGDEDAGGDDEG
ncbi:MULTISPECIES: sporulation protein [Streptomyces]|uniref:Sporulation protein n=1 Tax=Streptomyces anulatus TaxID=1892 RepID=A0A7K3R4D6_STRAQ|nr:MULTISPECIES: sporulation protein [Streptomyces]NDZ56084.1 sporulation protein [Streptomyces anulatus]NEB96985.1 sporulation protein [Streptomyces anulatus]NED25765.1 sporulation protein [Streptomyces anulatus]OWA26815.1 sporulation protein [Streptomyces sp. CS057]